MDEVLRKYLAGIGTKGGKTTGASKVRGDAAYYNRISKKAAQARKRKAANSQDQVSEASSASICSTNLQPIKT